MNMLFLNSCILLCAACALNGKYVVEREEIDQRDAAVNEKIEIYMEKFVGMYTSEVYGGEQKIFIQSKEIYADDFGFPIELTVYKNNKEEDIRYKVELYGETGNSVTDYYLCDDFIYVNQGKEYYSSPILVKNYDDVLYRETNDWVILEDAVYILQDNGAMQIDTDYPFYSIEQVKSWVEE